MRRITALAIAGVMALCVGAASAAPPSPPGRTWAYPGSDLPSDPDLRLGVLPNGLRYAIQRNDNPPGQVIMRLRVQAGSMHEPPDQLGYAHFLEHLAFRGSTHLADGQYASKLALLGAAFGADVNAFTTPLTTTFHIDLPRPGPAGMDTGLMLLREIASELSIKPEMLEAERKVVLAEERTSATVGRRATYAANGFLYDGHPYSRPVVGTVDSILNADTAGVRKFYDAYYRPERTVLAIVGDIDPAQVEAQIRAHFGDWQGRGPAGGDPAPAPDVKRAQPIFLYTEPGLAPDIRMVWKEPGPLPVSSRAQELARMREGVAIAVLSNRLGDLTQSASAPFKRASIGLQQIGGVTSEVYIDVNSYGNWRTALDAVNLQVRAAVEAPVDARELERALNQRRLGSSEAETRASTRPSSEIMQSLLADVDLGRVHQSPAQRRALFDAAVANLSKADVEAILRAKFAREPLVVITSPAAIPGGRDQVREQIAKAKTLPLPASMMQEAKAWPFESFGPAGKVVERRDVPEIGAAFVRFENGVRLSVKPSKYRVDDVLVTVRFGDGQMGWSRSLVQPERALWLGLLSDGGLQGLTQQDRNIFLSGKLVSLGVGVTDDAFVLSGQTREADLDVQMQLIAADMTAPAWRNDNFEQMKRQEVSQLLGRGPPQMAFRTREQTLLRSGDPRWATPSAIQVANTSYEQTRAFGQAMMAKGPIEVIIVGDVSVERAIAATAATLGALPPRPGGPLDVEARRVKFPEPPAQPVTVFHSGRPDQGLIITAWPTTDFFDEGNAAFTLDIVREILRQRLLAQLRVAMGDTYSPSVSNQTSMTSPGYGVLSARVEVPPQRMAEAFKAIDDIADDLAAHEVSADEFASAANPYVEAVSRQARSNSFWAAWLAGAQTDPRRIHAAAEFVDRARSVTAADVHKAAQTWLVKSKAWRAQIIPDPAMPPPPAPPPVSAAAARSDPTP